MTHKALAVWFADPRQIGPLRTHSLKGITRTKLPGFFSLKHWTIFKARQYSKGPGFTITGGDLKGLIKKDKTKRTCHLSSDL